MSIGFIGSAGIPNRYGGFEAFLEQCTPAMADMGAKVVVTCDSRLYSDRSTRLGLVERIFLPLPANGAWSVLHDLIAFLAVFPRCKNIVVLGVSAGPWFPLFRLLCSLSGKRLIVNVDGVEWRRAKFSRTKKCLLRAFDALAQRCSHRVVYDNPALLNYVLPRCRAKAACIAYSGDHVLRAPMAGRTDYSALTICRIEPENNIDLLIDGALASPLDSYTVVGNWQASDYGRSLLARFEGHPRLRLLPPRYDAESLCSLREACSVYLHGHSVGGTNPSLVEMLFYDCPVLCFDVPFNRETAGACAGYFSTSAALAQLLQKDKLPGVGDRGPLREACSAREISKRYLALMRT